MTRSARIIVLVLAVLLPAACADAPPTPGASPTTTTATLPTPPDPTGRYEAVEPHTPGPTAISYRADGAATGTLEVTHEQVDCCFSEGSWTYLVLRDDAGAVVFWREFQGRSAPTPALTADVVPGRYSLQGFERPCDANCGFVDAPSRVCSTDLEIRPDEVVRVVHRLSVRIGCRFVSA